MIKVVFNVPIIMLFNMPQPLDYFHCYIFISNFASLMNDNVNICVSKGLRQPLWKGHLIPQGGCIPKVGTHWMTQNLLFV